MPAAGRRLGGIAFAALLLAACGGGKASTRSDEGDPAGNGGNRELTDEEKFQRAHFQACEYMCDLLTRCSQVSLKAHWDELSEEDRKLAEQIGPEDLARHTAACTSDCQGSDLSVRQVEAIRSCLSGMPAEGDPSPVACEEYVMCLQKAQPGG